MARNVGNGDGATASVRVPSHYFAHHRREIKRERASSEDLDSISSLPDEILQVILSSIPTKFAIRTSVLSRRWRHVWSETPSLSFLDGCSADPDSIDKILTRYTARKMMSFQLCVHMFNDYLPYVDSWIEFAISRNVENLSLQHCLEDDIPDFLYTNSSIKQLYLRLHYLGIDPKCSMSWTSLKILRLHTCNLFKVSFAKILSGSPLLETLGLYFCDELSVLDLSKSPRLKTLEIDHSEVDVSSLTEAELDIDSDGLSGGTLLTIVLKFQNVEKLTFGENFLKVLSLASDSSFPKFKAKVLTFETTISRYVVPTSEYSKGAPKLT